MMDAMRRWIWMKNAGWLSGRRQPERRLGGRSQSMITPIRLYAMWMSVQSSDLSADGTD
jgi:hypothetical protein